MKNYHKGNTNVDEDIYSALKYKNALHLILKDDSMSSRERRNTLMKKHFQLCKIRTIWKDDEVVGALCEQKTKKKIFFLYMSPVELLTRFFDGKTNF